MDIKTIKNYEAWLNDDCFDEATKGELRNLKGNEKEIEDRFYKELEFGTGGLRGIIGAGTNRMNLYTVRKATQGLADFIKSFGLEAQNRGVVIAYDSRFMSKEFSEESACVLAANGIRAYVFKSLSPTPLLSFAVRKLNAIGGIVVTASHNPPAYNGYKVYWEDGAQVASELAEKITEHIKQITDYQGIDIIQLDEAIKSGLFKYVDETVEDDFIEAVKKQSLRPESIKGVGNDFKIVYTPLHGTGNLPLRRVLKEIGFHQVYVVPEQEKPDPNFSTVAYPNPEEKDAFTLSIELAQKIGAELIIGTDPDCDRVGAVVKDKSGEFIVLTGNQTGALLVDYILKALKEKNKLPQNGVVIKTIVTSEMGSVIANYYGIPTFDTLTGFKYIGEKIKEYEETGEFTYLFGYEESYGYLAGTHARDKDAVVASMLICEMAAYYHTLGMNLYEALQDLYRVHGYFLEALKSITLLGKAGIEKINEILQGLRLTPPKTLGDWTVLKMEDYQIQKSYDFSTYQEQDIQLPHSNVLKFKLTEDAWFCLRPSGTEPKLKIYAGVRTNDYQKGQEKLTKLMKEIEAIMN